MLIVFDFVRSLRACFLAQSSDSSHSTHLADVIFVQTAVNQRKEDCADCFV